MMLPEFEQLASFGGLAARIFLSLCIQNAVFMMQPSGLLLHRWMRKLSRIVKL